MVVGGDHHPFQEAEAIQGFRNVEEKKVAEQEVTLHVKKIWVILYSGSSKTENC